MQNEPVFLTDRERTTIIEVISGSANAALPDCEPVAYFSIEKGDKPKTA